MNLGAYFQNLPITAAPPAGTKKILFFTDSVVWGGAEHHLDQMVTHLDRKRFWPVVMMIRCSATAEGFDRIAARGIPVMHLSTGGRLRWRSLIKCLWWFLRVRPGLIHFNLCGPRSLFYPTLAALVLRIRYLLFENGYHDLQPPSWFEYGLKRLMARHAVTTICPSQDAQKNLEEVYFIPRERFTVIHYAVDVGPVPTPGESEPHAERRVGDAAYKSVIICVARMDDNKGHRYLIEAMARLPEVELWLVGDGPSRRALEEQAATVAAVSDRRSGEDESTAGAHRAPLQARITFLGQRSDVPELLAQADVFCLPSLGETLGISILEAMAARLPVVATRVGGIPEAVVNGETGYLVEPKNARALREHLARLLADAALRQRMGEAGRRRVEQEFSLEVMLQRTCEVYERGLSRN